MQRRIFGGFFTQRTLFVNNWIILIFFNLFNLQQASLTLALLVSLRMTVDLDEYYNTPTP
jgi:hypothetical protein